MSGGRFRAAALQVVARLRREGMSEAAGQALAEIIEATRDDAELVAEAYSAKVRAQREALDWAERAARAEAYAQELEARLRPRPVLGELSAEAKAARAPLRPEELVEALHDRVHRDTGRAGGPAGRRAGGPAGRRNLRPA